MFKRLPNIFFVARAAARLLAANDPLRMAGATAFFTTFALPPMLIVIVRVLGLFFNRRTMGRGIMDKLGSVLGGDARDQVRLVIRAVRNFQLQPLGATLLFTFLLFVATTLFIVIKDSINQLWRIRVDKKRHFIAVLIARLRSMAFILFTGILFLAVMAIEFVQAWLGPHLTEILPQLGNYVYSVLNHIVSLAVVTTWFFTLLRLLPDGRPRISATVAGAMVAGLLFSAGKYILRWLLSGNIKDIYGTSGALVVILLFVFYSALILYYGAAFTRAWGTYCGADIVPLPHASGYHITKDDVAVTDVQKG